MLEKKNRKTVRGHTFTHACTSNPPVSSGSSLVAAAALPGFSAVPLVILADVPPPSQW